MLESPARLSKSAQPELNPEFLCGSFLEKRVGSSSETSLIVENAEFAVGLQSIGVSMAKVLKCKLDFTSQAIDDSYYQRQTRVGTAPLRGCPTRF